MPRAVGLDDGPSTRDGIVKSQTSRASIVAVWFDRFGFDSMRIGAVQVDGLDSTDVILRLLKGTRTDVIFLSGASVAGFNIVDSRRLHTMLRVPIIVVAREKPNNASVKRAIKKHFADWRRRWKLVRELGRIHAFAPKASEEPLHFEAVGIPVARARKVIQAYSATSRVPEPIRVAGIMAKGLALAGGELATCGEKVGDAKPKRLKVHYRKQAGRRL